MIWTNVFPILDDEAVEEYAAIASSAEKQEVGSLLEEARIVRGRRSSGSNAPDAGQGNAKQMASASLLWRDLSGGPREKDRGAVGNSTRGLIPAWDSYFGKLRELGEGLLRTQPDVSFRLYVGANLDDRAEELASIGWDVHVMKQVSLRPNPAALWRLLALADRGSYVTVIDLERFEGAASDIRRTRALAATGLGGWRVPACYNAEADRFMLYRPMIGGQFGARSVENVRLLLEAFLWHTSRGTLRPTAALPDGSEKEFPFSRWLGFGFDEWFLLTTLYPRLAARGLLSFVPSDSRSMWLPFDLEYVMWCNPDSESVLF